MDAKELLERLAAVARDMNPVGETAAFAGFIAGRLLRPLEGMNAELAGRGDTRTVRADFRLLGDPDTGTLGGVEVALVLSDGTEFSRRYGMDADGVYGDRRHALACLLGDAALAFGLKDCYAAERTFGMDVPSCDLGDRDGAEYGARRDESVRFGVGIVDGEPAETELRYVEVGKDDGDVAHRTADALFGRLVDFRAWLLGSLPEEKARLVSANVNLRDGAVVEVSAWEHPHDAFPYYTGTVQAGGLTEAGGLTRRLSASSWSSPTRCAHITGLTAPATAAAWTPDGRRRKVKLTKKLEK